MVEVVVLVLVYDDVQTWWVGGRKVEVVEWWCWEVGGVDIEFWASCLGGDYDEWWHTKG